MKLMTTDDDVSDDFVAVAVVDAVEDSMTQVQLLLTKKTVLTMSRAGEVTDGASLVDGDAYRDPNRCDEHYDAFVVVHDYDYDCLNLRCLHLTAVFASFFYSSFSCEREKIWV